MAGNPLEDASKKMFFIVTHSPYFIDLKSLDDIKSIIVCHLGKVPTYIQEIEEEEQKGIDFGTKEVPEPSVVLT